RRRRGVRALEEVHHVPGHIRDVEHVHHHERVPRQRLAGREGHYRPVHRITATRREASTNKYLHRPAVHRAPIHRSIEGHHHRTPWRYVGRAIGRIHAHHAGIAG